MTLLCKAVKWQGQEREKLAFIILMSCWPFKDFVAVVVAY